MVWGSYRVALSNITEKTKRLRCVQELGRGKKQYFKIVHMCIIFSAAWDQSDKFVKIYLALKDVHKISAENVDVKFTER